MQMGCKQQALMAWREKKEEEDKGKKGKDL